MTLIKIFSTGSATSEYIERQIRDNLEYAQIAYTLEHEHQIDQFIQHKIDSIPAVQFNDSKIYYFNKTGILSTNLKSMIRDILEAENYGQFPKIFCNINAQKPSLDCLMYAHRFATENKAMIRLSCTYPTESNQVKHDISYENNFYKLVNSVDAVWGSDILSSAIIDAVYHQGCQNCIIHKYVEQDNPAMAILPGINAMQMAEYEYLLAPFKLPILYVPTSSVYRDLSLPHRDKNDSTNRLLHALENNGKPIIEQAIKRSSAPIPFQKYLRSKKPLYVYS